MSNKEKLTELFAQCHLDAADPDGGFEYSLNYAKSEIMYMSSIEIFNFIKNIEDGQELVFDPDFGDFITRMPKDE